MLRTAILRVDETAASDRDGERAVQAIRAVLATGPFVEVDHRSVADEQALVRAQLRLMADERHVDLVLSVGGTGLAPRARTPEATLEVVERTVPGIAEAIRAGAARVDPAAWLERGVAGTRRGSLLVNLPGAPELARAGLEALVAVLPAALAALKGGARTVDPHA